jgi:hypothetical protein
VYACVCARAATESCWRVWTSLEQRCLRSLQGIPRFQHRRRTVSNRLAIREQRLARSCAEKTCLLAMMRLCDGFVRSGENRLSIQRKLLPRSWSRECLSSGTVVLPDLVSCTLGIPIPSFQCVGSRIEDCLSHVENDRARSMTSRR